MSSNVPSVHSRRACVLALSLSLVVVVACHPPKAGSSLADSVRAYNDGVRWERFAIAAMHVPPKERSQFVDDADTRAKDLNITDYEVVRVDKKSDRLAEVHIKISWYQDSKGTLHETQARQVWERQGKTWIVVDEARLRGVEMPGLREPATPRLREVTSQQ